jgi:hypothetical protein
VTKDKEDLSSSMVSCRKGRFQSLGSGFLSSSCCPQTMCTSYDLRKFLSPVTGSEGIPGSLFIILTSLKDKT